MSDDPVILTRSRISDQINDIKLEYLDRANSYAASVVEVSDQALMDAFGRRAQGSQSAHLFCGVELTYLGHGKANVDEDPIASYRHVF